MRPSAPNGRTYGEQNHDPPSETMEKVELLVAFTDERERRVLHGEEDDGGKLGDRDVPETYGVFVVRSDFEDRYEDDQARVQL